MSVYVIVNESSVLMTQAFEIRRALDRRAVCGWQNAKISGQFEVLLVISIVITLNPLVQLGLSRLRRLVNVERIRKFRNKSVIMPSCKSFRDLRTYGKSSECI